MFGVLCVATPGEVQMLLWFVGSWVTLLKVRNDYLKKRVPYTPTTVLVTFYFEYSVMMCRSQSIVVIVHFTTNHI